MQATRPLLFKGFIGRSIDEFKRLSHIGTHGHANPALFSYR
jgi:hypothetical protein